MAWRLWARALLSAGLLASADSCVTGEGFACEGVDSCPSGMACVENKCTLVPDAGTGNAPDAGSGASGLGAPCSSDSDCASGYCDDADWCSRICTSDADCNNGTVCISTTSGSNYCFPTCGQDTDCSVYDDDVLSCTGATDVSGQSTFICSD
jgi:hypothetical protein